MPDAQLIIVTDATFSEVVERSPIPVLLNVFATWCGPCQKFAPVITELAVELANRIRVAELDVDQNPGTVSQFKVRPSPTRRSFDPSPAVSRLCVGEST